MSRKSHTPEDEQYFLVRSLAARFSNGRSLPSHTHAWGQLIYAASGVTSVQTEHGSWVAPPRWAVWAPAGVTHAMRFSGSTSLETLYLRPDRWDALPSRSGVITVSPLLRALIQRAVEIGMLDEREPTHVAMAELIVHELHTHPAPGLDLPLPKGAVLRRVADHVAETPADRSSHTELAARFGIGRRSLERGFEVETGLSLGRWRRQARLLYALRLLGAGGAVKQVALEAGFQSPSAFVAAFRATLGTTPARYFA
ncbi:MAG: helix-turn-helix transcriptional regulator [bacterium]